MTLPLAPATYNHPNNLTTQWQEPTNPFFDGAVPFEVEWTMIRVWNPCGISGASGQDIITLSTGYGTSSSILTDNARANTSCPANFHTQIVGQLTLPTPGDVVLEVQ